jgi:hypothetical protein
MNNWINIILRIINRVQLIVLLNRLVHSFRDEYVGSLCRILNPMSALDRGGGEWRRMRDADEGGGGWRRMRAVEQGGR